MLRPVWDDADGADGFVSLEVEPAVAHDTDLTIEQAHDFWGRVDRPNLMVKIPGTEEGVPAIEEAIAAGINVNVTLLFSVESYNAIAEAYIRGMERRLEAGESMDIHSVASFFVSRVDTEVDKRLEALGREDLRGIAAIANARAAYQKFNELFLGERFARLRDAGAPVQRPLWASTGVKDPRYPETKYVDSLVGPHTVNTMPMPTLLACAEQLEVHGPTADQDPAPDLKALADAGIDMGDVTKKLLSDGIEKFVEPFDALMEGIELAREGVVTGRPPTIKSSIPDELEPAIAKRVEQARNEDVVKRLWSKDESLWGGPGVPEIGEPAGLARRSADKMLEHADELSEFVESVKRRGLHRRGAARNGRVEPRAGGDPALVRRDSRSHAAARARLHRPGARCSASSAPLDLEHTLFVVSSKSGGTIETLSHMRYFLERSGGDGSRFVVVTDPGSPLVDTAKELGLPARVRERSEHRRALLGALVLRPRPGRAGGRERRGAPGRRPGGGAELRQQQRHKRELRPLAGDRDGRAGAAGARQADLRGRRPPIESFGLWAEQLVAESTGKQGKGILPVADEPLGDRGRPTATIGCSCTCATPTSRRRTSTSGWRRWPVPDHPTITLDVHGAPDLGRIFFFAEFATAVAGWVLGINPFDQPNVQEAKDNTAKVLEGGDLPDGGPRRPGGAAQGGGAAALRGDARLHGALGGGRCRGGRSCAARSATRRRPPPRSGTARATCTPPGSSTRAARRAACSCSSCTTAARTRRSRAPATRSST